MLLLEVQERIQKRNKENITDVALVNRIVKKIEEREAEVDMVSFLAGASKSFVGRKFGWEFPLGLDELCDLLSEEIIHLMPLEDFRLAFTGTADPKTPIICRERKVKTFIDVIVNLQQISAIPEERSLTQIIFERCLSENGKIPKNSISTNIHYSSVKILTTNSPLCSITEKVIREVKRINGIK